MPKSFQASKVYSALSDCGVVAVKFMSLVFVSFVLLSLIVVVSVALSLSVSLLCDEHPEMRRAIAIKSGKNVFIINPYTRFLIII